MAPFELGSGVISTIDARANALMERAPTLARSFFGTVRARSAPAGDQHSARVAKLLGTHQQVRERKTDHDVDKPLRYYPVHRLAVHGMAAALHVLALSACRLRRETGARAIMGPGCRPTSVPPDGWCLGFQLCPGSIVLCRDKTDTGTGKHRAACPLGRQWCHSQVEVSF